MKRPHKRKPSKFREIASNRIDELFHQAEIKYHESPEYSDRYVEIARKISMKYKVKMPKAYKRRYCRHCHKYLVPGDNCRVRINDGKIVYHCSNCKNYMRFPLK